MPFNIIVGAHSTNFAIGAAGKIPWKCSADMKFFKDLTTITTDPNKVNAVIMGRTTYMSLIPGLPNRVNIILTKMPFLYESQNNQVLFCNNFNESIHMLEKIPNIENIFVIGGEMVYKQAVNHPKCSKIYLNLIHVMCDLSKSDTFFPPVDPSIFGLVNTTVIDQSVTSFIYVRK